MGRVEDFIEERMKKAQYAPVMKFEIEGDRYVVFRMTYRGHGGWSYPLATGKLVSGDPATEELDGVAHGGLKYAVSSNFHLDATFGAGIWGESLVAPFATLGARWATE